MPNTAEYRVPWDTGDGGQGFSVLHFLPGSPYSNLSADLRAMFAGFQTLLTNEVTVHFPGEVIERDIATGTIQAIVAAPAAADLVGSGAGNYLAGTGACVVLETNGVAGGRRLRGRLFLVPMVLGQANGLLSSADKATIDNQMASSLTTLAGHATNLVVWSRKHGVTISVASAKTKNHGSLMSRRKGVG